MPRTSLNRSHRTRSASDVGIVLLYGCATLQFIRFYIVSSSFYLKLPAYLSGHERLPFQERVLPIPLIDGLRKIPLFTRMTHVHGAFTAKLAPMYVISLVAISVAGIFTQQLYRQVTRSRALAFLVYPLFLFAMIWTYSIHLEANYSYPYDMLSVAFFSAGLYFIYTRQFLYVAIVILVGTLNRETTLFLIGIYVLDSMTTLLERPDGNLRHRFNLALVSWPRVVLLAASWLSIELVLAHIFAHNSRAEDYVRVRENVGRLKPRLLPALLNICGYMLPIVLIFRRGIYPLRFRNYLWILPFWFSIMFYSGVILETRIYGELCPYVAVALVLIMEHRVEPMNFGRERLR